MKVTKVAIRAYINKSYRNTDGGWTKGEMEVSYEAEVGDGENPRRVMDILTQETRRHLYANFDITDSKKLTDWGKVKKLK